MEELAGPDDPDWPAPVQPEVGQGGLEAREAPARPEAQAAMVRARKGDLSRQSPTERKFSPARSRPSGKKSKEPLRSETKETPTGRPEARSRAFSPSSQSVSETRATSPSVGQSPRKALARPARVRPVEISSSTRTRVLAP